MSYDHVNFDGLKTFVSILNLYRATPTENRNYN
jgi:hypothetical protein